jgi:hypothetical protein
MSEHADQCPFLNRSDPRCSRHFSLEHLQNAFRFCFGAFETCPQYAHLLMERRARRRRDAPEPNEEALNEWSAASGVVQITVAGRVQKQVAGAA